MRGLANECGSRNSFGYYDASAKEIILKRPCLKKQDLEEAYLWLDNSLELRKFSIGIGSVEVFVADGNIGGLYTTARGMLKNSMMKNKYSDAEMLRNMLLRLKKKEKLRNLAVKCFIFNDDPVLFELLLDTIRGLGSLVYLDLTGCYFSDEQLADLADVISKTKIAHLVMAGTENGQDGSRQGDADFGNQQVTGGSFRRTDGNAETCPKQPGKPVCLGETPEHDG